jgi:two-component system OmpR family sensor kinase
MKSIRRQLLLWLLVGLTVATAAGAFAVYVRARAEARELSDYQLQVMAAAFPNNGFGPATAPAHDESNIGDVVVVQIWDQNGGRLYLSSPESPPQSAEIGFSTVTTPQGSWRIYSTVIGNNVVQVSQPMSMREKLAADLALRTILPLLLLLPVLAAMIWVTVGRGLRPLDEVAFAVGKRSADALEPLPESSLPQEVQPLIESPAIVYCGCRARVAHPSHRRQSAVTGSRTRKHGGRACSSVFETERRHRARYASG